MVNGMGKSMDTSSTAEARSVALDFTARLEEIYAESLIAVLLYGSAAREDYRTGVSDLNLLVILRELDLVQLRLAAAITADWVSAGNPPPLMLSEAEWLTSADVFPLEYSDIRDAHIILAGRSPFEGTRIQREHLRLQVEHELRSGKIQLREAYLVGAQSTEQMGRLLLRSLPSFLTLYRAVLLLAGRPVPRGARELIDTVASEVGFRPDPVLEVLRGRDLPENFTAPFDGPVAAGYLEAVERTVAWLDRHGEDLVGSDLV